MWWSGMNNYSAACVRKYDVCHFTMVHQRHQYHVKSEEMNPWKTLGLDFADLLRKIVVDLVDDGLKWTWQEPHQIWRILRCFRNPRS